MIKKFNTENIDYLIAYLIIILLPLSIVTSSLIMNLSVILLSLIFLFITIKDRNFEFLKNKFFILISIFFIYLILNLYNSVDVLNSLNRTFGFLRFLLLSFALAYFISFKNFKYSKLIFLSWLLIFVLISIDLLIEYIFGQNIFGFSNEFPGRLSGMLNDELKIGGYYFGFILISLAAFFSFYEKKLGMTLLIFFLIIGLLIGERSNFIKILFSLTLFIILINIFSAKLKAFLSIILIASTFFVIMGNSEIKNRFKNQFVNYIFQNGLVHYYYNSVYGAHYDSAIQIIKEYPLFGVGLKNFPIECRKNQYINKQFLYHSARCSTHPHQLHLDILTSIGIIGYSILIVSIFYLIIKNYSYYRKTKNLFTLSSTVFLVSILLMPVPSGSFFTSYGATIFWINVGILLAFEKSFKADL